MTLLAASGFSSVAPRLRSSALLESVSIRCLAAFMFRSSDSSLCA
eukprot:CAMPEP_0117698654 /NCGR_PEP_ID=MMETSP0804-20121206/29870_1 /TAXON_ID=1074897 /ORGANISM="Tetraselmis astigmatica, Strain CCMP880" /LENGTH=44 /DNA_ID= /DNA_START= /DNA_END= /DNA_ORIENTATION=